MENTDKLYDVIIAGAGPAGLSAAIYGARAKYKVLVLEKEKIGGQITITSEIVNYPGIESTDGAKLTEAMRRQAEAFGAEFLMEEIKDMKLDDDIKKIYTVNGEYQALGVIIAVGANPRKLGFPGEKEFQGRGVAYCATCDGEFFTGKEVFVVGGGFAAVEEGIFLTKYAKKITMIVREEDFTCAKTVADQIKNYPEKINVRFHTEVESVSGGEVLERAVFKDNISGEKWEYSQGEGFGMFIFAGYVPDTEMLKGKVALNEQGYVITDVNQKTSVEGVYAAGDVCIKNLRQVVTAVSDGAVAATALEKYVSSVHEKLNIPELQRKEVNKGRLKGKSEEDMPESSDDGNFITDEIREKLDEVFSRFKNKVILRAYVDKGELSSEVKGFLEEFKTLTDKVEIQIKNVSADEKNIYIPSIEVSYYDGRETGISFHGVPGGHEFNSFIVALYNVSVELRDMPDIITDKIKNIKNDVNIKIMVSLSCTMCPEVVMAAQKLALISDGIRAEMFDLKHYKSFKEQYNIMSVPCMIINDSKVFFGKKTIDEIADIISN